jgi:2-oxoglutarate ferredoxin oxidoreductase subunit gamma
MSDQRDGVTRIRLTGRGGQGIMLAGAILAEAAMNEGRQVTETQEYGPEARLGATKAEVILSARPIAFPQVLVPDILVCLSREGFLRYGRQIAPDGMRLVEQSALGDAPVEPGLWALPWRALARGLGQELAMNMAALGSLARVRTVVSLDAIAAAVRRRVKPDLLDLNLAALTAGYELAPRLGGAPSEPAVG